MKNISTTFFFVLLATFSLSVNAQKSRIRKGDNYFKHFSYSKAIIAYEGLKTKSPRIYRNLAKSYLMLEKNDKAETNYEQLINSGKYKPIDLYNYASVLLKNKKYKEASTFMERFSKLKPNDSRGNRFVKNPSYYDKLLAGDKNVSLSNLDINSKYQDFSPAYYKDHQVVFASSRDDSHLVNRKWNGNNQPFLNLYLADIQENNVLANVKKFSSKINKELHDAPATFNGIGDYMIVTRNNYDLRESNYGITDNNLMLYESFQNENDEWSIPKSLHFNNKDYSCGQACLTSDGEKMYFTSDMPGGFGGTDIYVVNRAPDGKWGMPVNLGPRINTEGNEMFPYFDEKNKFLFYSSNGLPGLGGLDVFVSKVRRDGSFTLPKNLGAPINSNDDDFSFIYKEEGSGFLSSNRVGGKGDDDIYSFTNLLKFKEDVQDCYLSGTITDKVTKEPLDYAHVFLYDKAGKKLGNFETKADGKYFYPIDCGEAYKLVVIHDGYQKVSADIDTKDFDTPNIVKDFALVKFHSENKKVVEMCDIHVKPLYYDLDKYYVRANDKIELDKIVVLMNKYPRMILEVSSHTDSRATYQYNEILSKNRNNSVVNYLVGQGISRDRLIERWFGETRLINGCVDGVKCTEAEHQLNRRTEFRILNCRNK